MNLKEYTEIFNHCFPQFAMREETFKRLLLRENTWTAEYTIDGLMVGYIILEEFAIRLICVEPDKQRQGIGSELLMRAEEYLMQAGFDHCITGGISSGFLIGANEEAWPFFEKKGFVKKGFCDEMLLKLSKFTYDAKAFRGHEVASYGWYQGNLSKLHQAVAAVEEDWVQYFEDPARTFVGIVGDEIASFCLVDADWKNYLSDANGTVGGPGCVGTVPKFRNQGIGIEMVALATDYLKKRGVDVSFIFFTGVAPWYQKIGYEIFVTEIFGEKNLTK